MYRLVGSISLFPYDFDPQGWTRCDGRTLPIFESETLFQLLGDSFGGDGQETFGLPNLDGAAPKECRYCISMFGVYPRSRDEQMLIGETVIWAAPNTRPPNLVECNGQMLSKSGNMFLETFIDARFGQADAGKFKLPDLQSRYPAKCSYLMSRDGFDPVGNTPWDPFVGEIRLLPYEVNEAAKQRWRLCDGGQFAPNENPVLANLLGKRFGGGNEYRFPDLRAAAPPKCNYYFSLRGVLPPRG